MNELELLVAVGLGGHCLIAEPVPRCIERAKAWLKEHAPMAADLVENQTRRILWLQRQSSDAQNFASTTFANALGTTFLTKQSLYYIPPATVIKEITEAYYPLAENLYHEATHQQMYQMMERQEIIKAGARGTLGPKVHIPWRNLEWTLEHAFHAFEVYKRLAELRKTALEVGRTGVDFSALEAAVSTTETLRAKLIEQIECFGESGQALVYETRLASSANGA